jgi:uncharacterized protein YbjT (DUF2867 family)
MYLTRNVFDNIINKISRVRNMKLVIFGASGQTGRLLTKQALEAGHLVTAYLRRADALPFDDPNLKVAVGRLDDEANLREAITGADACLSTLGVGSLKQRAPEVVSGIDRIVTIMEETGVKRFIYLSSLGAGESRSYMPSVIRFIYAGIVLRKPLADHTENENRISRSGLNWTVVRPGGLTLGPETGNFRHGSEKIRLTGNPTISRADVAAFMLSQVSLETYSKTAAWIM